MKIGLVESTSGAIADFGLEVKRGVDLAAKEINAAGGVDGAEIVIVHRDAESDPEESRKAAKDLIEKEEVSAGIGCVASGLTIAVAPFFQDAGIPLITPSATNPRVTELGDKIFRACFMDEFQARGLALYAWRDMSAKNAAILQCKDSDYSKTLADAFKAKFEELGGTVVAVETARDRDEDFSVQLARIKDKDPDVLFLPMYYLDVSTIAKQAAKLELKAKFLGCDGWESPSLLDQELDALEGAAFSNHFFADADDSSRRFAKAFKDEYSKEPTSLAALGYDTLYMLSTAMTGANGDSAKIAQGLASLKAFDGVTGTGVNMNEKRNAEKPLLMLKLAGGKLTFVRAIKPEEVAESSTEEPEDK